MATNNKYTTDIVTTSAIPTSYGLLDNGAIFPPPSMYKMVFTPKPGQEIQAAGFRHVRHIGGSHFNISYSGVAHSHTQWPSRFQLTAPGLGTVDPNTPSGYKEFPGIYKVVFTDSTNPNNVIPFPPPQNNQVYMWIYFGRNESTGIDDLNDIVIDLDIDYDNDPWTLSTTSAPGPVIPTNLNNFNI